MLNRILADCLVVVHGGFVLFVVLGGLLALKWPKIAWIHLPACIWGALIEFRGWICPLTPLEKMLRVRAGQAGYEGGFIEHYLVPLIYPPGLTEGTATVLGILVLVVNAAVYACVISSWRQRRR